jgi:hypothetical protein
MIRDLAASHGVDQRGIVRPRQTSASLEKSAEDMAHEYGDYWLHDFVRSQDSSGLQTATSYLIRAIHENQAGEPDFARSNAHQAQQLFNATQNLAGILRARFEEVYALHRLSRGTDCLAEALALQRFLAATRYSWLQVQTEFELSVCKGLTGDLGGSFTEAENLSLTQVRVLNSYVERIRSSG